MHQEHRTGGEYYASEQSMNAHQSSKGYPYNMGGSPVEFTACNSYG